MRFFIILFFLSCQSALACKLLDSECEANSYAKSHGLSPLKDSAKDFEIRIWGSASLIERFEAFVIKQEGDNLFLRSYSGSEIPMQGSAEQIFDSSSFALDKSSAFSAVSTLEHRGECRVKDGMSYVVEVKHGDRYASTWLNNPLLCAKYSERMQYFRQLIQALKSTSKSVNEAITRDPSTQDSPPQGKK